MDPNEYCKWELREVYYLNRLQKERSGMFFEDVAELTSKFKFIDAADIEYISNGKSYRFSSVCKATGQLWAIREDGLIVKEKR